MKRVHPLSVFVCILAVTFTAAAFSDPVTVTAALATGTVFALLTGVKKPFRYWLIIPVFAALQPLFVHRGETVLFFINNSPVTAEAVLYGLNSGAMLSAVLLWFAAYNRVMDSEKHLYLFGRFTPKLGVTVSMAMRFAPLFANMFREISAAQKAMGLYSSQALPERLAGRLSAFGATVTRAFENGVTTAMSMDARGCGHGKRTSYSLFRFTFRDGAILAAAALFLGIFAFFSEQARFLFYPVLSQIKPAPLPRLAYFSLCIVPIAVEIMEIIKWRYSALKISASHTSEQKLPL